MAKPDAIEVPPDVRVQSSHLGLRLTCTVFGCRFDDYVGQSVVMENLTELVNDHLRSVHG